MTNFVLLYSGGGMPDDEEEQARVMAAWGAWYEKLGAAVVDAGNPFGMGKGIGSNGSVNDSPTVSGATGYTVISADSLDAAVSLCEGHPHLGEGGQISVYETFNIM